MEMLEDIFNKYLGLVKTGKTREKEGATLFKCSEILDKFCRINCLHFNQLLININGHIVVV